MEEFGSPVGLLVGPNMDFDFDSDDSDDLCRKLIREQGEKKKKKKLIICLVVAAFLPSLLGDQCDFDSDDSDDDDDLWRTLLSAVEHSRQRKRDAEAISEKLSNELRKTRIEVMQKEFALQERKFKWQAYHQVRTMITNLRQELKRSDDEDESAAIELDLARLLKEKEDIIAFLL